MSTREAHLLADVYYLLQRAAGAGGTDYGSTPSAITASPAMR